MADLARSLRLVSPHQYTVDEFEAPVAGGAPAAHKVLISKRGMKLHNAQSGPGSLTVIGAGKCKPEALRQPCLPRTGRALEDKVHLGAPAVENFREFCA